MRILVANDDGINAEGLRVLVDFASKLGEVTVCAPKEQQSGKSHAINIYTPFEVKKVEYEGAIDAYAVDSTPADCVRFGTLGLNRSYDVVFSGVNRGLNMGEDIVYSGTAGAIFEAKYRNIKGIAFSTQVKSFDSAREWLPKVYQFIVDNNILDFCDLLNVNIPLEVKGIRITKQGGPFYTDNFTNIGNDMWQQLGYCVHESKGDLTIDSDATTAGYITITPLNDHRTDLIAFDKLSKLLNK